MDDAGHDWIPPLNGRYAASRHLPYAPPISMMIFCCMLLLVIQTSSTRILAFKLTAISKCILDVQGTSVTTTLQTARLTDNDSD